MADHFFVSASDERFLLPTWANAKRTWACSFHCGGYGWPDATRLFSLGAGNRRCVPGANSECRPEGLLPNSRHALRFGWSFNSAHEYRYWISSIDGWSAAMTSEHARKALGSDGRADAYTGEVRGFVRAGGRHAVLAFRGASGIANGDGRVRRIFTAGGPGPKNAPLDFGSEVIGLLRGFDTEDAIGSRAAIVNVDYRWPIAQIQRGLGTWPFFVRTLHASISWTPVTPGTALSDCAI